MIKSSGIIKKVDIAGRISIPIHIRRNFNIREDEPFEVLVDDEKGQIIFQKPAKTCFKCKSTENLKEINQNCYLCSECIKKLK